QNSLMKLFTNKIILFLLVCASAGNPVSAQSGAFDVRFLLNNYDCNTNEVFIDVEIKAADAASTFRLSDQNYRFSFNRSSVNAVWPPVFHPNTNPSDRSFYIQEEQEISSFVMDQTGSPSFYSPHTLTGSIDTIVSLNVELSGGSGVMIEEVDWVKVSRLRVNINDPSSCVEFLWHTHAPTDFPPTFIGEKVAGSLFEVTENSYGDLSVCLADLCSTPLPVELTSFEVRPDGCNHILSWATASEVNSAYFEVQRSVNGLAFESLGRVNAAGNSEGTLSYEFIDRDANISNYYRLVQVDLDGASEIYGPLFLQSECFDAERPDGLAELFPNPATVGQNIQLTFYHSREAASANVVITDIAGRLITALPVDVRSGANQLQFSLKSIAEGTYFVQLKGADWFTESRKLVVIHP
ncbi:MAG: T9SS type A sorting domain-containing protein, partial [Bacteroidota bacterium]